MNVDEEFLFACIQNDSNSVKKMDSTLLKTDTLIDSFYIIVKNNNKDLMLYLMRDGKNTLRYCLIAWEAITKPGYVSMISRTSGYR